MRLIFITNTTVIPISNIKGFEIKTEYDYEVVVYYIDGQDQSCEHAFDETFENICDAQTFIRDRLENTIIDTE